MTSIKLLTLYTTFLTSRKLLTSFARLFVYYFKPVHIMFAITVTTSRMCMKTEVVSVAVGWLVNQEVSHGGVMTDSQSMLKKIEKHFLWRMKLLG